MKLRHLAAAALGLALPFVAGCRSDEALNPPNLSNNGGLLERYVSMGNSITAGFQSAGINDSTQLQSYAVLFAHQAGAPFFVPLLNQPGCPPPFTINTTNPPTRLGGGSATDCSLREGTAVPYLSNVAVPGVTTFGVESNTSPFGGTNALTQFILGGRTQIQAMMAARPTFVSVWVGDNDVLGALTDGSNPGNPALITPVSVFEGNYGPILDSIERVGAKAVLLGVADVASNPFASSGAAYWCLKTGLCPGVPAGGFPAQFSVDVNCAPKAAVPSSNGDSVLVPWTVGVPKLAAAQAGLPTTLDCSDDNEVVLPSEFKAMRLAVAGYNSFIASQAQARGWAFVDIATPLLAAKTETPAPGQQPKITTFPCLPGGPCGGTTNATPNVLFGLYFTLDGVHPSAAAHRVVANLVIDAVNSTYGTTIPTLSP
jgi:hypothetical protein